MIKLILISFLFCIKDNAQNICIGTFILITRPDVDGTNGRNVSVGDCDMLTGNPSYRLKFKVALSGGGAGVANIMQYGQVKGFDVLLLGAQSNPVLFVNKGLAAIVR